MRPFLVAKLAALTVIVSGCSHADPTIRTELLRPTLPASARTRCDPPSPQPDRDLSAREVSSGWNQDRTALKKCETRRAAAVNAVDAAP